MRELVGFSNICKASVEMIIFLRLKMVKLSYSDSDQGLVFSNAPNALINCALQLNNTFLSEPIQC